MNLPTAIIGDIHGCGVEFEELTQYLLECEHIQRVVLTGDLFTKGPTPDRVVHVLNDLLERNCDVVPICGNQDLRLFSAMLRLETGLSTADLPKAERRTCQLLEASDCTAHAIQWLATAVDKIQWSDERGTTVVHGGIDPELGLAGTSDYDKVHMKARDDERHWWLDYDGRDGLIVVGHKPVDEPVCITHGGSPVAINIDTGCVYGGRLTSYLLDTGEFIAVESRQIPRQREQTSIQAPLTSVA